jgi:hypothetical protein
MINLCPLTIILCPLMINLCPLTISLPYPPIISGHAITIALNARGGTCIDRRGGLFNEPL